MSLNRHYKVALVAVIGLIIGAAGFKLAHPDQSSVEKVSTALPKSTVTKPISQKPSLEITQWGVELQLTDSLKNKIEYEMGKSVVDSDGMPIDQVKLLVSNADGTSNNCEIVPRNGQMYIYASTQLLRTPKDFSLDTARYRGSFMSDIFTNTKYNFHANFLMPECSGPITTKLIEQLQQNLKLKRI